MMGTTLHAAVQEHYDASEISLEHFDTVCVFELNKDYELMAALDDVKPPGMVERDRWWPDDSEYADRLQVFDVSELPSADGLHEDPGWNRYQCLLDVCARLAGTRLRVVFWRF
jgi:hypothetical protein